MRTRLAVSMLCALLLPAATVVADDAGGDAGVVLAFEGAGGVKARAAVVRALAGRVDLVGRAEVEATAARLGVDLATREGRAAVAGAHGLRVIVTGEIEGRGASATLTLRVYDGEGREVATRDVGAPATAAGRRALATAAREASTEALEDGAPPRVREVPEPARDVGVAAGEDAADPGDVEADTGADSAPEVTRPPYVRLLAGAGGRTRDVEIRLAGGGARVYDSGVFFDVPVLLEVRPLAGRSPAAGGFLVRGDFALAPLLASGEQGSDDAIDTTAYRFGVHAGYEHAFDRGALGAIAGFAYEVFDLAPNPVLPSSRVPVLRAGLLGRVDIAGALLAVRIEAGFRALLSLGDLGAAFGDDDGGLGFDAALAVGGYVSAFEYALRAGYEHSFLRFGGGAADAAAREGVDRGFAMAALVGFRL